MCRRHPFATSPFNGIGAEVHGGRQVHCLVVVHPVRVWERLVGASYLPDWPLPAYLGFQTQGETVH